MDSSKGIEEILAGHRKRNAELAVLIVRKGASLDEPRLIECHFWASSEDSAEKLALELQRNGFTKLRMGPSASGTRVWNLEMTIVQSPRFIASEEFTVDVVQTAARFDARFDGWGTSL
jgi:regulator of RNase E activity RraB